MASPRDGLLRFLTCGSVDDGKSTLIGRLLLDTKSILADALHAIEATSRRRGLDAVDLSLLTDGLQAEREQGITIDVARSEEHTSELQSRRDLVCRLLLEKKKELRTTNSIVDADIVKSYNTVTCKSL